MLHWMLRDSTYEGGRYVMVHVALDVKGWYHDEGSLNGGLEEI